MIADSPKNTPKSLSPDKPARKPKGAHALRSGTPEANRLAVAILEVLAGIRSPAEAATNVNLSLVRYFQLETRALQGMVRALEPLPKGKQPSLDGRLKQLEKQLQQSRRECSRQQALVRVAQRTVGLPMSSPSKAKAAETGDRKGSHKNNTKKKRRPMVRALKAAQALRAQSAAQPPADSVAAANAKDASIVTSLAKNDRRESALAVQQESTRPSSQERRAQEVQVVSY
jgi:hypothetical protein